VGGSYSERAPSLHELNSRYREGSLYTQFVDYADEGTPGLGSEKLAMGNIDFEYGTHSDAIAFSAAGGKVMDGINWVNDQLNGLTRFRPLNSDVDFLTVSGTGRARLWNLIGAKAGASYHHLDQEGIDELPFSPEFEAFAGAELQLFWPQKLIRFFAYGEMTYTSEFSGYFESNLGNAAVFNTKLSFQLGSFRFHWIIQNSLSNLYGSRDFYANTGRYSSYGFTWNFLD